MMTVQEVALRLLFRIGVTSLDPNQGANSANMPGFDSTNDIAECVTAINGAYQEIFSLGPTCIREDRRSWQLFAPLSVTIGVVNYSNAITSFPAFTDSLAGCTIRITGDGLDNEIVDSQTLLRPFQGATGSITATVFADCIPCESDVENVLEPVKIPTILAPLLPSADRQSFETTNRFYGHYLNPPYATDAYYAAQNKVTGEPRVWFAESRYNPDVQFLQCYLRLNPMPGSPYPITARVKLKPPTITAADIGTFGSPDPATKFPQDFNESVILPIAMKRFRMHPSFDTRKIVSDEIDRQAALAMLILEGMAPMIAAKRGVYNF